MTIRSFDSFEEMQAFMQENAERAAASLHDAQRGIGFGDHWVRFVDIANREVEFGYVYTLDEVKAGEIAAGATPGEANDVVRNTEMDLGTGHLLFGKAYIHWQPEGELGTAHRAAVWPISNELFDAASEVDWDIDALPGPMKLQLEAKFQMARMHALRLAGEVEG